MSRHAVHEETAFEADLSEARVLGRIWPEDAEVLDSALTPWELRVCRPCLRPVNRDAHLRPLEQFLRAPGRYALGGPSHPRWALACARWSSMDLSSIP
mgnify:CR=1 FL=1